MLFLRKTMDSFLRIYSCNDYHRIYEIGPCFRNEFITSMCASEFEMLSVFSNYISIAESVTIAFELIECILGEPIHYVKTSEKEYIAYIDNRLKERNYQFVGTYDKHKQKSEAVDDIFEKYHLSHPEYAIFEHTSCALSYLYGKADYNQHFFSKACNKSCDNYTRCMNDYIPCDDADIDTALRAIGITHGWRQENEKLIIDAKITDEQRSYIRHILQRVVVAPNREPTYSEKIIENCNRGDE
ncbi:MAG: hypothetical protein E7514_00685 [Ruminococcaceae bacterium]|nr:hypothetical protein [Oscillospiraceae bacterium]